MTAAFSFSKNRAAGYRAATVTERSDLGGRGSRRAARSAAPVEREIVYQKKIRAGNNVLLETSRLAPTGAKECSHGWSEAEPVVGMCPELPAPEGRRN